jgi:uncharacterized membrane protein
MRVVRPVFAWLLACLLATVVLTLAGLVTMIGGGIQASPDGAMNGAGMMAAGFGFFIFLTIAATTALPWLAISWAVHLTSAPRRWVLPVAGGLLGTAGWLAPVLTQSGTGDLAVADALAMGMSGLAGLAGGWLYARMTRPR